MAAVVSYKLLTDDLYVEIYLPLVLWGGVIRALILHLDFCNRLPCALHNLGRPLLKKGSELCVTAPAGLSHCPGWPSTK